MKTISSNNILDQFNAKWKWFVDQDLKALYLYKTEHDVFLKSEFLKANGSSKIINEKLDYITSGKDLLFDEKISVLEIVTRFLALDSLSMIHCFDYLFTKDAIEEIINYTSQGVTDEEFFYDGDVDLDEL